MLLRDETQLAMNRVETLCFEAAGRYDNAAQRVDAAEKASLFADRAQQLRARSADLAPHIRRLGDLPQQPDPDRETVSEVLSGIKAFLSGDPNHALAEEQLDLEKQLAEAIRSALRCDVAADTQSLLEQMLGEAETTQRQLRVALA